LDELHTASIISAARGPSGKNDIYLYQLSDYLSQCVDVSDRSLVGDSHTTRLTALSKLIQEHRLYFLYGSGSNQHDQLLLKSSKNQMNSAKLVNDDEAHDLKEFVLVVPKGPKGEDDYEDDSIHRPKRLFAGGGHSGLLTHNGNFYLWGWNDDRQLGRDRHEGLNDGVDIQSHPIVPPLDIKVVTAALGHSHTLIIEKGTKSLYAFGDDNRGQVGGGEQANSGKLTRLDFGKFVEVSAGLFHSAGVTENGELVTFGCGRFGQSLCISADSNVGKWSPPDGSRLVKVVCGRRHTVCVDEHGRVWSMGDNKYGQLGRQVENERDQKMELVDGILGQKGSGCVDIDCGWSHTIATVETDEKRVGYTLYGWGRNDKSQIAFNGKQEPIINSPRPVGHCLNVGLKGACCGSESISILDVQNNLMSCGWNEHGNLGIGHSADVSEFTKIVGANILSPYNDGSNMENDEILIASGGAHFLATKVVF
jgi:alpha-tubulin suppressor-like RCC1 family protein